MYWGTQINVFLYKYQTYQYFSLLLDFLNLGKRDVSDLLYIDEVLSDSDSDVPILFGL